jgi:hypothetical protein
VDQTVARQPLTYRHEIKQRGVMSDDVGGQRSSAFSAPVTAIFTQPATLAATDENKHSRCVQINVERFCCCKCVACCSSFRHSSVSILWNVSVSYE